MDLITMLGLFILIQTIFGIAAGLFFMYILKKTYDSDECPYPDLNCDECPEYKRCKEMYQE